MSGPALREGCPCELCGYSIPTCSSRNPKRKKNKIKEPFSLLGVTDTAKCILVHYQCPSCHLKRMDMVPKGVREIEELLGRIIEVLIRQLRKIRKLVPPKTNKKDNNDEASINKASHIESAYQSPPSTAASSDEERDCPFPPDTPEPEPDLAILSEEEETIKVEIKEEDSDNHMDFEEVVDQYLQNEGVLLENVQEEEESYIFHSPRSAEQVHSSSSTSTYSEKPMVVDPLAMLDPDPIQKMGIGDIPAPETTRAAEREKTQCTVKKHSCPYCPLSFRTLSLTRDHIRRIHQRNPEDKKFMCSFSECGKKFYTSYKCRRHEMTHTDERNWKCEQCGNMFKSKLYRDVHMQRMHTDIFVFKCPDCPDVSFKSEKSLERHQITVHQVGDWPYLCLYCGKGFNERLKLNLHENNSHGHGETVKQKQMCSKEGCGKEFSRKKFLNSHLRLHKEGIEDLKCPKCLKEFDNYLSFRAHEKLHRKIFSCPEPGCGKKFGFSKMLKVHITSHSDQRNYVCEKCDKSFKTSHSRYRHMREVHREEPFRCGECTDVSFKTKESLNIHLHSVHEIGEWPFPCPHVGCGKGFTTAYKLKIHIDVRHSEGEQICSYEGCGKHFQNARFLKAHEELHEKGIDSLKCEKCFKEYDNYRSFQTHQKSHRDSERNQFPCPSCNKIFSDQSTFKQHMDCHQGVRKFQCGQCGRLFATTSNLRSHQKSVHEKGGKPRPNRMLDLERSTKNQQNL